jgi:hypothetical protein
MRILAAICLLLSAAHAAPPKRIEIDFAAPKVDNEFSRSNPDYKERAGSFYEREYLPETAEYLFEVCSIDAKLHPYVMEILRAFIYEWCDAYMRGDGDVSVEAVAPIVGRMEARIISLLISLLDEGQKERYPAWRNTRTGKNSMKFLMDRPATKPKSEQDGPDQPATPPQPKSEDDAKPKPQSGGRSQ